MQKLTYMLMAVLIVALLAACQSRERTGALIGGAAGTVAGEALGGGAVATLLGAAGGAAAGYFIGGQLDEKDKQQIAGVLEDQPLGETTTWTNPDTGVQYQVTPTAAFERDGQRCRRFELSADDKVSEAEHVACRTDEGNWRLVEG